MGGSTTTRPYTDAELEIRRKMRERAAQRAALKGRRLGEEPSDEIVADESTIRAKRGARRSAANTAIEAGERVRAPLKTTFGS